MGEYDIFGNVSACNIPSTTSYTTVTSHYTLLLQHMAVSDAVESSQFTPKNLRKLYFKIQVQGGETKTKPKITFSNHWSSGVQNERKMYVFACCEREENHNMPAITVLLETEEINREELIFWVCKIFHKLRKENKYPKWFLLGLTKQFKNRLSSISN